MTDDERRIWDHVKATNPHLSDADDDLLGTYCTFVVLVERLREASTTADLYVDGSHGNPKSNPIFTELRQSSTEMRQLAASLRLTPATRAEAPATPQSSLTHLADRRAQARGRATNSA